MPREVLALTVREKAAIIYQQYSGCTWVEAYTIASGQTFEYIRASKNLNRLASHWKNTEKVQTFVREQKAIQDAKQEAAINKAVEAYEREHGNGKGESVHEHSAGNGRNKLLDYSDPDNRKRLYNEIIQNAKDDPKTQLDAAKTFEQLQRDDKQAAREQKQVRTYLPQQCSGCPLYIKARERAEKR